MQLRQWDWRVGASRRQHHFRRESGEAALRFWRCAPDSVRRCTSGLEQVFGNKGYGLEAREQSTVRLIRNRVSRRQPLLKPYLGRCLSLGRQSGPYGGIASICLPADFWMPNRRVAARCADVIGSVEHDLPEPGLRAVPARSRRCRRRRQCCVMQRAVGTLHLWLRFERVRCQRPTQSDPI